MLSTSCFPIFENNKKWKEGKSPKRNIKGLRKEKIKKNKNGPQKKKEIKIRHESEQVKMPLLFTFTARIMIMCRLFKMP